MTRRTVALAAVLGIGLAQLIPCDRSNPPVTDAADAPAEVAVLLRRACYDCHSNETRWPWYSRVAPVAWLVSHDVTEGRDELNFSSWQRYPPDKRGRKATKSAKELREGEMPPWYYAAMHPEARLTAAEQALLTAWLAGR